MEEFSLIDYFILRLTVNYSPLQKVICLSFNRKHNKAPTLLFCSVVGVAMYYSNKKDRYERLANQRNQIGKSEILYSIA